MAEHDPLVPFTKEDVLAYLDACIHTWRRSRDIQLLKVAPKYEMAEHYIDAFQSVRSSLFGELLPEEEEVAEEETVDNQPGGEQPPTAQSVGNHHWPDVANVYEAHGNAFPDHHSHEFASGEPLGPQAIKLVHQYTNLDAHTESARWHDPEGRDGCR